MKARQVDWSYLRGALRWMIAAGACSGALLGLSGYYLLEKRQAYEQLRAERETAREDYLLAESRERVTGEYYLRYQALRRNGLVGSERRLDWVEAVQESARSLHLPKIQYQIMPREEYALDSLPPSPGWLVYASRMRLEMELMHEGDLAAIFGRLERVAPGAVHVQSCSIRRLQEVPDLRSATPNLAATCGIVWFTIQPEIAARNGAL
jgi:hypothetical protein